MNHKNLFPFRTGLLVLLAVIIMATLVTPALAAETETEEPSAATERGVFLSDLDYISSGTRIGYGTYHKDTNINGTSIQLRLDGSVVTFDKGIGAHATSTITFDISRYSDEYTRFTAKLGVDASQGSKGGVWFRILVSNESTAWNNNTGWTELLTTEAVTAGSAAISVDLDVTGYDYIRLYADQNGGNGNDHSVFADARLVKSAYNVDSEYFQDLHKVSWYDAQLAQHDYAYNLEHNRRLLLERELVSRLGLANIQSCIKNSPSLADALRWLLNDGDALQLFIETGNIYNGATTLQALDTLYGEYKDILGSSGDGYIYKKMLLALAVTWANDTIRTPYQFGGTVLNIDLAERFRAVKWIYDNDKLYYGKELFRSYNMELMRALMGDYVGTDEVQWIQHYGQKKYPDNPERRTGPYAFMAYVHPPFYNRDEYFAQDTWQTYNEKYDLDAFNIPNSGSENRVFRVWMVYEAGGICWNISRIGQTLNRSYGIPAIGTFQPSHEAYFVYSENAQGQGLWSIGNNVFGWQSSYNNWSGMTYRYLLNWGSGTRYVNSTKNNGAYMLLAQNALNQYDALWESQYLNLLADSYDSVSEKLEIYRASLEALELNLDTYQDIISLYIAQGDAVTDEQWGALAMDIIKAYTYHPVPMVDLLTGIEGYLGETTLGVNMAKINALKKAQAATAEDALQYDVIRVFANSMLGATTDDVLATFSFDGENAGCIVINESYESYDFQIQYSLDGGESWTVYDKAANGSRIIALSKAELASIHEDTDILMFISGQDVNGEDPEYFVIDIQTKGALNANSFQAEDRENYVAVSGASALSGLEYSLDGGEQWQNYVYDESRFPGDVTVQMRYQATGNYKPGPVTTFTFTENQEEDTFRYIPIRHLELVSAGTHQSGKGPENMLDANSFTEWHSRYGVTETNKTMVIAFDTVRSFAGIRYLPGNGPNGRFATGLVYTSMDGENWTQAGNFTWGNSVAEKECRLEEAVTAKYVKIEALTTYTNGNEPANRYVSGRGFAFFEDSTKTPEFVVSVKYSTYHLTNGDVTATLVRDGLDTQTHVFAENGTHTFTYLDQEGLEQTIEAQVTWIDKTPPTGTVVYEPALPTNGIVYAYILPDEEHVTVLNGTRDEINPDDTGTEEEAADPEVYHVFQENGTYDFQLQDEAGNTGIVTAQVTWIDTQAPTAVIRYQITESRDAILACVVEPSETVVFGEDQGTYEFRANGSYEFVFHDLVGNETRMTAQVTAFDENGDLNFAEDTETSGVRIEYSTELPTNESVTATLILPDGYQAMGPQTQYVFRSNGEYQFVYQDDTGKVGVIKAAVTWIDKTPPTGTVHFSTTQPTNGNVTATLTGLAEDVTILHPANGSHTIEFTDNGDSYFQFSDALGNTTILGVTVDWIDRTPATGEIRYDTVGDTVVAHVVNLSETVIFGQDSGTYTFTENGSYTFVFHDLAGNETRLTAAVDSFREQLLEPAIEGSGALKANAVITAPAEGWKEGSNTFTVTCDKVCYVAVSQDGGQTYTRLKATRQEEGYAFTLDDLTAETRLAVVVAGDLNGDGKLSSVDCAILLAVNLELRTADALNQIGADANGDGRLSAVDEAILRAVCLELRQLSW